MVAVNFNANAYEPSFGSTHKQLPPCKKTKVIIFESGMEPTKSGQGNMLVLGLRVVEGPLVNQECAIRLNVQHVSTQAVEIANKQLSAICHVTGVYNIAATEQLHNIPFLIDVDWQKGNEPTQEKPEGGYTEVKALYDANGNAPGQAGKGPVKQAAPVAPPPPVAVVAAQPALAAWAQKPANGEAVGWGNR